MDLYHRDIRLPEGFRAPSHSVNINYSRHALKAAESDRYGTMILPPRLALSHLEVIEVGMENGRVAKILFRTEYDHRLDMCIVLVPGPSWFCKTVWFNERTDKHKSLDRSKYVG